MEMLRKVILNGIRLIDFKRDFFIIPGYGLFASVSNDVIIASVYKCQIFWGFWDENLPFNELPGFWEGKSKNPESLP